ncbi:hypothetical protein [Kitasatospora sp. NPDC127116]|uniref:hypothetical protein n=1 Tax=Kitasatospora sp. NPDC127116 TaxID=3345367 RepID=UPI00363462A7
MTTTGTALRRASAEGRVLATGLTTCLATAPAAAAATASVDAAPAAGPGRYHRQRLEWRGCARAGTTGRAAPLTPWARAART